MVCAEQQCTNHANPSLRSGADVKGQANVRWTPSAQKIHIKASIVNVNLILKQSKIMKSIEGRNIMIILKKFKNRFEADSFAILLDQNNIPYIIQSADSGGQRPASFSIDATILVSEEDYEEAKNIIIE